MTSATTHFLDSLRGTLVLHRRQFSLAGRIALVDHLLSCPAGSYLIQERSLPGRLDLDSGSLRQVPDDAATPGRELSQNALLDDTRRTAEALESRISRPLEPVLVVRDATPFSGAHLVRGVQVVHELSLPAWFAGLAEDGDKASMVMVNARLERATSAADRERRIPEWEIDDRLSTTGVRAVPSPPSARPADPSGRGRRGPGRAGAGLSRRGKRRPRTVGAVVALLVLAVVAGVLIGRLSR